MLVKLTLLVRYATKCLAFDWRLKKSIVDRNTAKEVMGITYKGNRSTASIYKPGEPYFYALLKVHKLNHSELLLVL